ncbi:NADH-quinone oxidoreductase subunit K (modular protein) [Candidatus Xenohaliotis californiensis]|uniref:NADH-quinone oxidoreductase subunit K n=1 Tax=Candidatus Xenohaliotis californiensis TaxID=84677 RepID=A0ABM9N8H5_9RICK|nr:NADH-quinone oxidoreductase subunit K (modular protein) [Candidatus Xenohaliotis californiensis]
MPSVSLLVQLSNDMSAFVSNPRIIAIPLNSLGAYSILSFCLFSIAVFGVLINSKNILVLLASIELIFLAAGINFASLSSFSGRAEGQVFSFFLLAIAAAKVAIGLGIIIVYYKKNSTITIEVDPSVE